MKAIDWTGSILIVGSALMILLGVDFGDVSYPWSSATVICLIVFGSVATGMFIVNEWKFAKNPVIPLHLFSPPSTSTAYVVFTCNFYIFIGLAYYLPLYSQSVLGANALGSGLHLLPLIVSCSLSAAAAGLFIQKTGKYRPLMYAAQVLLTLGSGLFLNLDFEKSLTKLFIFEIITGIGVGLNIEAPILAAQAAKTVRETATVVATMSFVRSIGTAISIVAGGVIFQNQMNTSNPRLIGQVGQQLASKFDGAHASANVELIRSLPVGQQDIIRRAYFGALKSVWIMVRAFFFFSFFDFDRGRLASQLTCQRFTVRCLCGFCDHSELPRPGTSPQHRNQGGCPWGGQGKAGRPAVRQFQEVNGRTAITCPL